ncbi:MAG: Holliday junction resolvase RuvX [Burkholderiales bacterium]|nr:Holliday junction resolvase RuvX [Burkholderiales bacterium]
MKRRWAYWACSRGCCRRERGTHEPPGRPKAHCPAARSAEGSRVSTVVLDVPPHYQTFLAFDFGLKRTGVAVGNRMLRTATPQATIKAEGAARLEQALQRVKDWQPDALVIGVPFHPDGASHENTQRARKFARQLRSASRLEVYEVDERYSTTEAASGGAADADAGAACVILEQFLRSLP